MYSEIIKREVKTYVFVCKYLRSKCLKAKVQIKVSRDVACYVRLLILRHRASCL